MPAPAVPATLAVRCRVLRGPGGAIALTLSALLTLVAWSAPAHALPDQIMQEGLVLDAGGRPVVGAHAIRVRIFDQAVGGEVLFDEVHPGVEFFEGYYAIAIGAIEPLDDVMFAREALYLSVRIDQGEELRPRTPLRKVPAAFTADVALDVVGDIHPSSVSVPGAGLVIDGEGRWVGDPTGLRGPAGPIGPAGPQGPVGPQGAAGGDRSPDTPAQVRDKLRQVDGTGSGVDADLLDGLHADRFMRTDRDTSTRGSLTVAGEIRAVTITLLGADGVVNWATAGGDREGEAKAGLALNNNNIAGVNALFFRDPGPLEGLIWSGTQARIFVSPADGADADGLLRLVNDAGISLESDVSIAGDLYLPAGRDIVMANGDVRGVGRMTLNDPGPDGAIAWAGTAAQIHVAPPDGADGDGQLRLINDDGIVLDSPVEVTGPLDAAEQVAISPDDAGRSALELHGRTAAAQPTWIRLTALSGRDAGGDDGRTDGGFAFDVSAGRGAARTVLTAHSDGDVGIGTDDPRSRLHVADAPSARVTVERPDGQAHVALGVDADRASLDFADDRPLVVSAQPYGNRGTGVAAREVMRVTPDGRVGIGVAAPTAALDVAGAIRGPHITANGSPSGMEHNILFGAHRFYRVVQQGPARFDVRGLFDGVLAPVYPANPPTADDPHQLTVYQLPAVATHGNAWIGWTSRAWGPARFTVEGYSATSGQWRMFADHRATPHTADDFLVQLDQDVITALRVTIYEGRGPGGRVGLSELMFVHPEVGGPYENLRRLPIPCDDQGPLPPGAEISETLNLRAALNSCVVIRLEGDATYTWDGFTQLPHNTRVVITGRGASTVIRMRAAHRIDGQRCASRMEIGQFSYVELINTRIAETIGDPAALYPSSHCHALFVMREGATFDLTSAQLEVTENVVNFEGHAHGRVRFGHTSVVRQPGVERDVYIVLASPGWNFGGNGGIVSRSHTNLGPGVRFHETPRIRYLD